MSLRDHSDVPSEHFGCDHPSLHGRNHLCKVHRAKKPGPNDRFLKERSHHHEKRVTLLGKKI